MLRSGEKRSKLLKNHLRILSFLFISQIHPQFQENAGGSVSDWRRRLMLLFIVVV